MGIKYNFDYAHRKELRNHEIEMFQIAKNIYSCISYACCLMLMYEYLIAFHFGNRDILVDDKVILKTFEHAGDNHKVLKLLRKIRNVVAHNSESLRSDTVTGSAAHIYNSNLESVELFDNAEEDKDLFIRICKECCKALMNTKGLQVVQSFS